MCMQNICRYIVNGTVIFVALCFVPAAGAEQLPPPNPHYPYTYTPPITKTETLNWTIGAGSSKTVIFDTAKYGELRSAKIAWSAVEGYRSYSIFVPPASSLYIRQTFTFTSPAFKVNTSGESGPTFTNSCSDPSTCSGYTFSAANVHYNGPGITGFQTVDFPLRFQPLSPKSYLSQMPKITGTLSVSKPVPIGRGYVNKYVSNTRLNVSLTPTFKQWQVNEVLAGALRRKYEWKNVANATDHGLDASYSPNFGFDFKAVARAGRYYNGQWITYDHFNWIQRVTGFYNPSGQIVPPNQLPPEIKRLLTVLDPNTLIDPRMNGVVNNCPTDFYRYLLSEIPFGGFSNTKPSYPCKYTWVGNDVWQGGLHINDRPDLRLIGWSMTFNTQLVGVLPGPYPSRYEVLAQIFPLQKNDFSFNWRYIQTGVNTNAGRAEPIP